MPAEPGALERAVRDEDDGDAALGVLDLDGPAAADGVLGARENAAGGKGFQKLGTWLGGRGMDGSLGRGRHAAGEGRLRGNANVGRLHRKAVRARESRFGDRMSTPQTMKDVPENRCWLGWW